MNWSNLLGSLIWSATSSAVHHDTHVLEMQDFFINVHNSHPWSLLLYQRYTGGTPPQTTAAFPSNETKHWCINLNIPICTILEFFAFIVYITHAWSSPPQISHFPRQRTRSYHSSSPPPSRPPTSLSSKSSLSKHDHIIRLLLFRHLCILSNGDLFNIWMGMVQLKKKKKTWKTMFSNSTLTKTLTIPSF